MRKVVKTVLIFLILLAGIINQNEVYSTSYSHQHRESSYQRAWAEQNNGICEYKNDDGTRVDCLTDTHAIEFDFANKWAESIGQALYYKYKTGKRAKVILILEHPETQMVYYQRVKALSKIYDFDVDYVTTDILKTDSCNRCSYSDCKCHKIK